MTWREQTMEDNFIHTHTKKKKNEKLLLDNIIYSFISPTVGKFPSIFFLNFK